MKILPRIASLAAVSALALVVVGCTAAVESTGSEGSDMSRVVDNPTDGPAPTTYVPTPVPFPPSPLTYCPSAASATCRFSPNLFTGVTAAEAATAAQLGCATSWGYYDSDQYKLGVGISACPDTPAARAAFSVFPITCNTCIPALPSGEIYLIIGSPFVLPDCPSGCGTVGHGRTTVVKGSFSN